MLVRTLSTVFLSLMLAVTPAAPVLAQEAETGRAAAPASVDDGQLPLWKISDSDNTVYLMGSVHLLKPDVYPLDSLMQRAYEQAEVVAFEVNLDSLQQKMPMMMQRAQLQGQTLKDVLSAETYQKLDATMDTLGLPPQGKERLMQMKPWLVGTTLPQMVLQRSGYQAGSGVDMHFYQKARQSGKERMGLETIEEQISKIETVAQNNPDVFIQSTLEELDGVTAMVDSLTAAWERGDVQTLGALMSESLRKYPTMREVLLVERNRAWISPIKSLIEGDRDAVVIVGAGHLVGEESVVALLREEGYTVTQQ